MDKSRGSRTATSQSDKDGAKTTKDCRVCNRRRIKCDRSIPSCKKCISRNLACSGYGVILNWDWGVASRGKLAGKTVPVVQQASCSPVQVTEQLPRPGSEFLDKYHDIEANLPSFTTITAPLDDAKGQSHTGSGNIYGRSVYQPLADNCLVAVPSFSTGILRDNTARHLFHHYGQTIAATMAWVDTSENQWRSTMISLALQSNPLLLSMLAFAAEHLSSVTLPSCSSLKEDLARRAHNYRDSALTLLASDMRSTALISDSLYPIDRGISRNEIVNPILASMLMLCNMETIRPDSRLWRLHLEAARTVANMQTNTGYSFKDETFRFLAEQLFVFDAFACTTAFEETYDQELLTDDNSSVFTEFLRLIKWVTSLERKSAAGALLSPESRISSSELCHLFEQARDCTLSSCSQTAFSTPSEGEQFLGVIESFHHAGLLYSYRCLSIRDSEEEITHSRAALFKSLDLVQSDHPAIAQNTFWPLFIAGTEASSYDGSRTVMEQKLNQAMKRTGFSNCEVALQFLRALWIARDEGHSLSFDQNHNNDLDTRGETNWIECARHWTSSGKQFLVF
ncbi:fungal-specific transcription factor domain-containing protein [Calycina marina]|uniref:Fungal-specific transcription factor domain-containing protein n=1 Tax=Calycina marina TaxID=1763456 RepID=A0A9P8CB51_9HELO|nr:fungal-specific transcription factor domain-containing protein [Calycina marina]